MERSKGIRHLSSENDVVVVTAHLPELTTQEAFLCFVMPERLRDWWVPEAEIEPWVAGHYRFCWPEQDWVLAGVVTAFEAGNTLGFTWQWEHRPDLPTRRVRIDFVPDPKGCRLTVTHGVYSPSQLDQDDRQSHIDGWLYFLGRLQTIGPGPF